MSNAVVVCFLAAKGMIMLSCPFPILSVADVSFSDIAARYIKLRCIDSFQDAGIIKAIEFVSTKMTVSFSKREACGHFLSTLLGSMNR